ncbi:MAG: dTMP kinase [Mariprofundaceae bacterium]
MKQGHFISFEGIDGCGKSTQLELTRQWLAAGGVEVVATREPGDTPIGREIRALLLDGRFVPCAETELLLFLADRAQHVREMILPALERGAWVLCDRYSDSTLAYQLAARRLGDKLSDSHALQDMLDFAECGVQPDMTLWFDLDIGTARERMQLRQKDGEKSTRLDDEAALFHQRVGEAFAKQCEAEPERIVRLDAALDITRLQQDVCAALIARWPELGS